LDAATRQWGPLVARRYSHRLQVLRSFAWRDLLELRSLRLHPLRGERAGSYAADLTGRWRLLFSREGDEYLVIEEVSNHYGD
jgi:plasmid maintenance system killer protein